MRLALLWALGLLRAGNPVPSRPLPGRGGTEEEHAQRQDSLSVLSEPRVLEINPDSHQADGPQTGRPGILRMNVSLDGKRHVLELWPHRDLLPGHPRLVWHQPDGTQVVSEGHSLENCCYRGRVQGRAGSWASVCTCSGLSGLVSLSPERSYALDLGPRDLQEPPAVSRIRDILPAGRSCTQRRRTSVPTRATLERPVEQSHGRRRRDVVTETKVVELVIVADHSEVQRYSDPQRLLNRTLEAALLLDMFFKPLNVRVALVGLEAWAQRDLVEVSRDPGVTLHNFLLWRREDLLPRLPHDSAQLVTATEFSGPHVGMAIQSSICSPHFSGGVNMDHSTSVLGLASSIAHELGHSLGLSHEAPGSSCPCPGPAPAKGCIMEASTDFLPGLNFSNCSRQALEDGLLGGMGSCLLARAPGLPSLAGTCGNGLLEQGEQCDCGFPDDCADPCCDPFTCHLRTGAQCASAGLCCHDCQLRPAGWQCRPAQGDCDLPESCLGNSSQCPPDLRVGDGEPCAGGQAVCMWGRCASYTHQCQALWGLGSQPAPPLCLRAANTRGDTFGNCGRSPAGSYVPCDARDAVCGQLQCQGGRAQPLLGTVQDLRWETLEANGTRVNCSWVHLNLGGDVAQPLLALSGTACGPGLVCLNHRCQPIDLLGAQECRSRCHGHGVCDSNRNCHCEEGWAPPDCATQIRATSAMSTGLLLSLLALLVLVLLGASYWHRARLRQRLCQIKGPTCQYRAAQPAAPEHPGSHQRTRRMPGAKTGALGFPAPPSRPLPPDPVPKRLQAELAGRPSPPTRPLPADPVVRRPQGPAKPPLPRKPLALDPQAPPALGTLPSTGTAAPPQVVPSRPAPPPPTASPARL